MATLPDFTDKPTVLIVDDTPDNLQILNDLLKGQYKVKVANGGEPALRLAAAWPLPEVILLDIMMPDMDGYEVCRRLKQDSFTSDIPVIFLTARSEIEDEEKGFELGCVDYITKPISPPIVLARVKTHVRLKRALERLRDQTRRLEADSWRRTSNR